MPVPEIANAYRNNINPSHMLLRYAYTSATRLDFAKRRIH